MAAGEALDDHHGRPAAGTGTGVAARGIRCTILTGEAGHGNERRWGGGEQRSGVGQMLDPGGIGQQAIMADAVEP